MAKTVISSSALAKKYETAIRAAEAKYKKDGSKGSKAAVSKAAIRSVDAKFKT
jgi:hypothetical protein